MRLRCGLLKMTVRGFAASEPDAPARDGLLAVSLAGASGSDTADSRTLILEPPDMEPAIDMNCVSRAERQLARHQS